VEKYIDRPRVVDYVCRFRIRLGFLFINNNFDHLKPSTSIICTIHAKGDSCTLLYRKSPTHTRLIDGLELKEAEIARFGTLLVITRIP